MSTKVLRESGVAAKSRFFEDLGLLPKPWEAIRGIHVAFGQLNVSFKYPDLLFNSADHVVSATTAEVPNAYAMNLRSMQELASSRVELDVLVDYCVLARNVLLKNGGQKSAFRPAPCNWIYCNINLVRVGVSFGLAFTQGRNAEEFLASHTGSPRTFHRTALLFCGFVQDISGVRCHLFMPFIPLNDENVVRVPNEFSRDAVRNQRSMPQDEDYSQQGNMRVRLQVKDFHPGISKKMDVLDA